MFTNVFGIPLTPLDALDFLISWYLVYQVLRFLRGTRGMYIFLGVSILLIVALVAQILELATLSWFAGTLKTVGLVALVIIFQPEIRRALITIGRNPLFRELVHEDVSPVLEELSRAVFFLSRRRIGALVVLERRIQLEELIERGVRLDARLTQDLLFAIFQPQSPLHDGAVIIRGDRVMAARVILPLLPTEDLPPSFGTRHQAARSLALETDAVCLVVSEESGAVRTFVGRSWKQLRSPEELKGHLQELFAEVEEREEEPEVGFGA